MAGPARATAPVSEALAEGRRKSAPTGPRGNAARVLALQRAGGNAAVTALLEGKAKSPGDEAVGHIDAALQELRGDDPVIDTVEKGLKAAEAAGVPVQLEGPKPSPSALAVTMTGFGPDSLAPPGPAPSPKPVPATSRMGTAAAKAADRGAGAGANGAGANGAAPPSATAVETNGAVGATFATPLSADQLAEPPVPPTGVAPTEDPAFNRVSGNVSSVASEKRAHPAASAKAQEAQNAAEPPTGDIAGQAKAAKVDTMDAQKPGTFDKKAFIAAVKAAIEAKSPKTLEEADQYAQSGKPGEVKGEVKGLVTQNKQGEAKDIETATAAEPDTSKAVPKPVTPMGTEEQGVAPSVSAEGAAPKPAPAEQLNLEAGKQQVNQDMADAQVTDEQLAQSNEPAFQKALADKQTAAAHADTAPGEYRQQEQGVITQSQAQATTETQTGVAGMHDAKAAALAKLVADKGQAKSKDEGKRAEVTARVQEIYAATETDVKKILDGIDAKVDKAFEEGEASARQAFESFVTAKMDAYKEDRYSGWLGGLRWAKDKLVGMPDDVNRFYEAGRELYLKQMDGVISRVADIVGDDLGAAKRRIAAGKNEIASYVKTLPANLQSVGAEATKEIGAKFEQLESDVDAKQQSVVDSLADKYVEARKGLDDRIGELQAENKGLVDQAIGAIAGVISTIRDLANMLMNTLARVADTVGDIIKHPIQFLGNLVEGVKGGILKFKDNILDHLRKGLMTWLFGALADAGIELPETFDVKGIIHLLLSLFGLTWTNIRSRIVKQIGEPAMAAIEKGVEIFQTFATQGVAGLWNMLLEKLGDIKEMILSQVKDFVVTKIITAGITWLIGLLNPAAAFIKACKLIYDIIMFFVDNGERIMKFVNTVIDSVRDILAGNIGAVVNKIDDVLGQMVPILIGFLASAIGIGGIAEKIKEILQKLQKPVNMAIDFLIKKGLQLAGPIIAKIKGIAGKVKGKIEAGKAWVKGKYEAGKAWVKGKVAAGEEWAKGKIAGFKRQFGFSAVGRSHQVIISASTPDDVQILVASTPRQLGAAMSRAMDAADIDQIPGARDRVAAARGDVEARERALRDMAREVMIRTISADRLPASLVSSARGLANAIAKCWEIIGYDGEAVNRTDRSGQAGEAGDVHRHGNKGSQYDPAKEGRLHDVSRLESEHVVPWSWIQRIVNIMFGLGDLPAQSSSRAYPRMTTVMTYERAAEFKTSQLENNDAQFRNWIDGVGPREARRTLADHLPSLVKSRMQIIRNATTLYVAKVEREESALGVTIPDRPDDATITRATAGQLAEIFATLREAERPNGNVGNTP